jgi:transposase-like protein
VELSRNRSHQEVFVSHATHANAALTPRARLRLARLIVEQGWSIPRAAERYDVSWKTAKKWADRYEVEGPANGKIERFHRTLVEGWAFKKFYNSESARLAALPAWIHQYNHHRPHSAIGKAAPITRLDNLTGHHT